MIICYSKTICVVTVRPVSEVVLSPVQKFLLGLHQVYIIIQNRSLFILNIT